MPTAEVFQYPTVKMVAFEIRFPNLFYLESRMGEFQLRVMERFPESKLTFRRQFVVVNAGPDAKVEDLASPGSEAVTKVWQFTSADGKVRMSVTPTTLTITSEHHKTYDNKDVEDRFRDTIRYVVSGFLDVMKILVVGRIGLRYVDDCPIPPSDVSFSDWYDSVFPTTRFRFPDMKEYAVRAVAIRDSLNLIYSEVLTREDGKPKFILDFDGFVENVPSQQYLDQTDKIHDMISAEYLATVKEPVLNYMRTGKVQK